MRRADCLASILMVSVLLSPFIYKGSFNLRLDHMLVYVTFLAFLLHYKMRLATGLLPGLLISFLYSSVIAFFYLLVIDSGKYQLNIGSVDAAARPIALFFIFSSVSDRYVNSSVFGRLLLLSALFVYSVAAVELYFGWDSAQVSLISKLYGGPIDSASGLTWLQLCARGGRLPGPFVSAPALGQFSLILYAYLLVFFRKHSMLWTVVLIPCSIFFGIKSGSFSYYAGMLIIFLVNLFLQIKNMRPLKENFILIFTAAVFLVGLIFLISKGLTYQEILGYRTLAGFEEFSDTGSINKISGNRFSGRTNIFEVNVQSLENAYYLGSGFAWDRSAFYADSLFYYVTLHTGVIGVAVFALMLLFYLRVILAGTSIDSFNVFALYIFVIFIALGLQSAIYYRDRIGDLYWIIAGLTYSARRINLTSYPAYA